MTDLGSRAKILGHLKAVGGEMELCCNQRVVEEGGTKVRRADIDPANKELFRSAGLTQWTELRRLLEELEQSGAVITVERIISQMMELTITDEGRRMAEVLKHNTEILSDRCRIGKYRRKYENINLEVSIDGTGDKNIEIQIVGGHAVWFIGRNGSGKTTLMNKIASNWKEAANDAPMVIEASRSTKMEGMGGVGTSGIQEGENGRGSQGVVRISGEHEELGQLLYEVARQEKAKQERVMIYGRVGLDAEAGSCLRNVETVLEATNRVLEKAGLVYTLERSGEGQYRIAGSPGRGIDTLSDGERAALQMALAILSQADGTLIVLDEPDKHLSPDTARDMLTALREERQNSCFVMATHSDVEWDILETDEVYEVKQIHWHAGQATWELNEARGKERIGKLAGVIRRDQRPIVLVEGTLGSLDRKMYEILLPYWKVIPRDSATKVRAQVQRINETADVHGCNVRGIVDGDGTAEAGTWVGDNEAVWVLPVTSIENVYWGQTALGPVIEALARLRGQKPSVLLRAMAKTVGGPDAPEQTPWEYLDRRRLKGRGTQIRAKMAKALGRPLREIEDMVLAEVRRQPLVRERLRQDTGLANWPREARRENSEGSQEQSRGSVTKKESTEDSSRGRALVPRVLYEWIPSEDSRVGRVQIGVNSPHGYQYTQIITRGDREIYVTIPSALIGEEVTVWAEPEGDSRHRTEVTALFQPGLDERSIGPEGTIIFERVIHEIEQ